MEIKNIESFLVYYARIRQRTKRVIQSVQPEHLDWAYADGKFTVADQIRHIAATERFMFAETIAGRACSYSGCGKKYGESLEQILNFMDEMHQQSLAIFGKLTPDELLHTCKTPGNAEMPVWKWLRAMIEHEIHHRAQLYIYLNMLGLQTEPIFGLTAEEVQERSIKI